MSWAEVKKINSNLLKSLDTLIAETYNVMVGRFNNTDNNINNVWNKVEAKGNEVLNTVSNKMLGPSNNVRISKPTSVDIDYDMPSGYIVCRFIPKHSGSVTVKCNITGSSYSSAHLYMYKPSGLVYGGDMRRDNEYHKLGYIEGTRAYVSKETGIEIGSSSGATTEYIVSYINVEKYVPIVFVYYYSSSGRYGRFSNFSISYDELVL